MSHPPLPKRGLAQFPSLDKLKSPWLVDPSSSGPLVDSINALLEADPLTYFRWKCANKLTEQMAVFFIYADNPTSLFSHKAEHFDGMWSVHIFSLGQAPLSKDEGLRAHSQTPLHVKSPKDVTIVQLQGDAPAFSTLWSRLLLHGVKIPMVSTDVVNFTVLGGTIKPPTLSICPSVSLFPQTISNLRLEKITIPADSYSKPLISHLSNLLKLQLLHLDPTLTSKIIHEAGALPKLWVLEVSVEHWSLEDAFRSFPDSTIVSRWKNLEVIGFSILSLPLNGLNLAWRLPPKVQYVRIAIEPQALIQLGDFMGLKSPGSTTLEDSKEDEDVPLIEKTQEPASNEGKEAIDIVFITEPLVSHPDEVRKAIKAIASRMTSMIDECFAVRHLELEYDIGTWVKCMFQPFV